jgi:predicted phage tail protein
MNYSFTEKPFAGRKGGGGSAHTPVEQPDDLLSEARLKMLIAISEGEIQGDLTAQEIYLNDTPLANADGSYNFEGITWEFRTGTQDQEYIPGMPEVDNEMSVGVKVTESVPWTRQFSNLVLDAVRIKLSLPAQYRYKDNGDMVGTVTEYAIDLSTDGGTWEEVVRAKFDGKTTSEYQRDHRINFPASVTGWSVRVRRLTPDSTDSKLVNAFSVSSFAEVIDSKLRYPNTALLYIEVNASQFNGSAPKVTCKPKGKIIRVPDNYDPVYRTYSGSWSGGFKWAYSNNPAWIFYDLILDEIYGMGSRIDASMVDKWELYEIARYCDESVSDGAGGTEPRFTCDAFIQSQQDAYTVLNDLAAVFRGITFWGNEQLFVKADVPQDDVDWVYTASNVINGNFTYAGGSYKNRYSSCLVSWSDPINHYSDTVEGVYDSELVERYQINQLTLTAIGCTKQSEAHRRGRWALLSSVKDGSVTFGVGLDGYIPLPSQVIGIADPFRAGLQNGGRMKSIKGREITLDREVEYAAGDRLVMNMPDGTTQSRTIESLSDDRQTVTITTAFSQTPVYGAVWAIDSDRVAIQYFRVMSVAANDDETGGFTISAIQHDPEKYRYIDDGVRIESPPITVTPVNVLDAPDNIVIEETDYVAQGLTVATMYVSWARVEGAIRYVAQWRKDNGDWINVPVSSAQGFSVEGIYSGSYDVRVRALNAQETSSPWGYADNTFLSGKQGKPGTPTNFRASDNVVWNIDLSWSFPDGSGDTAYIEIERATTSDLQNPQQLTLLAYPSSTYQHGPMKAGVSQWYRVRLVDRIGNVGDWTDWTMGMSSADAGDLLGDIADDFLTSADGDRLTGDIDTNLEGVLQNALANHGTVEHQWAQYGEVRADILVVKTTIAQVDKAMAEMSTQVQAQIDDVTAVLEDKLTAVVDTTGASAIHTLKVGVRINGIMYNAGMSIAVLAQQGQPVVTRVGFNADQFVLMSGSGDAQYSPFAVVNGQVFISSAFFQDASINFGKISDTLQSTNFVTGSTGWRLPKSGNAELNNVTVRGTLYAASGNFSFAGSNNVTVINGNGLTVNIPGGGKIVVGTW